MPTNIVGSDVGNDHIVSNPHINEKRLAVVRQPKLGAAISRTGDLALDQVRRVDAEDRQVVPTALSTVQTRCLLEANNRGMGQGMNGCRSPTELRIFGIDGGDFGVAAS